MGMGNENLGNSSHLYSTFLYLMLSAFSAIEEPDISVKPEGKGRVISRARRLRRHGTEKCDIDVRHDELASAIGAR